MSLYETIQSDMYEAMKNGDKFRVSTLRVALAKLKDKKIDKKVEKMFAEGVVAEVRDFLKMKVNKELSSNKIIGIKEIKDYIDGKITLIKTKELIKLKTRQYAKRQFTWARGHMRSWEMIYSPNSNDLFKQAINKIS